MILMLVTIFEFLLFWFTSISFLLVEWCRSTLKILEHKSVDIIADSDKLAKTNTESRMCIKFLHNLFGMRQ